MKSGITDAIALPTVMLFAFLDRAALPFVIARP
jgi:hypothetical protein